MKPKYFVVKQEESNPLWQVYIDWLNKTYNQTWKGNSYNYYGYDGYNNFYGTQCYNSLSNFQNNPTVLTLDQWYKLFIDILPEKWFLKLTKDNLGKADEWRKTLLTTNLLTLDSNFTLLSKHLTDPSCYYGSNILTPDYKDYQEITTEQFIKHVYNPKFNIMEEYVIKNLTIEHGAEIVQHFKDLGVDTINLKGSACEENGDKEIYYGVINGKFSNYYLKKVQNTNTPIRELPKKELKMYSIKEIETNYMLIIYLDSQEEWDKLNTITKSFCPFYGKHCYNLYRKEFCSSSNDTNVGSYKNATIITINQIKELKMTKEIVGYRLVKPEYHNIVKELTSFTGYDFINLQNYSGESYKTMVSNNGIGGTSCYNKLEEAGVLDLWFEPVYKKEEKIYTLGIDEKFEISVRDKKAFYGDEDVTETLVSFQNALDFVSGTHRIGKYHWCIADTVIESVGCISKQSLLSQWQVIKLD